MQNDLIAGEGGIESTESTKMLLGIAGLVETLKTGQVVTMDGGAGTVRVEGENLPSE